MFNFLNFSDMYHQFKCLVRWITNYLFDSVNNFELWPPHLQLQLMKRIPEESERINKKRIC